MKKKTQRIAKFLPVLLLALLSTSIFAGKGSVIPYNLFKGETASTVFSVSVNGVSVPVHSYANSHYVHFAFAGQADISVTLTDGLSGYKLSPVSLDIPSNSTTNTVSFSLFEPRKMILHHVKNAAGTAIPQILILFAESLEENPPKPGDPGVVNVLDHGADKTGIQSSYTAFTNAVKAVPSNGVLYVPAGTYVFNTYSFKLKSNMTMYLEPGAELKQETGSSINHNIVDAYNCNNLTIKGRGRLNGVSANRGRGAWHWYDSFDVIGANNFRIEDVLFFDAAGAQLWIEKVDGVSMYNVKFLADSPYLNTDAMDFISTINADADNIFCRNADDMNNGGTVKGGTNSYDNVIRNVVYYSRESGAPFAVSGGILPRTSVYDSRYENADIILSGVSTRILSGYSADGGGDYHDLTFNNIRMEEIAPNPVESSNGLYCKMSDYGNPVNQIYNITYDNYWLPGSGSKGNQLFGADSAHMIKNVTFNQLYLRNKLVTDFVNGEFRDGQAFTSNVQFTNVDRNLVNITALANLVKPGESGTFRISRGGPVSEPVTVHFNLHGNAIKDKDYAISGDSLTIPAGQAYTDLPVTISDSINTDSYKQIILVLKHGNGYMIDRNFIASLNIAPGSGPVRVYDTHGSADESGWTLVSGTPEGLNPVNTVIQNDLVRVTYPCEMGVPGDANGSQKASHVLWLKTGRSYSLASLKDWGDWTYVTGSFYIDPASFTIAYNTPDSAEIVLDFPNHHAEYGGKELIPVKKHVRLKRGDYGYTAYIEETVSNVDGEREVGFGCADNKTFMKHVFDYSTKFGWRWAVPSYGTDFETYLRDVGQSTGDWWATALAFDNSYYRLVGLKPTRYNAGFRIRQFPGGCTGGLIRYAYPRQYYNYEAFIAAVPYNASYADKITVTGSIATVNIPADGHYMIFTEDNSNNDGSKHYKIAIKDLYLKAGGDTIDLENIKLVNPVIAPLFNGIDFPDDISLKYIGAENKPPTAPSGLTASSITDSGFDLNWTESVDNVGVLAYDIYKDRKWIGQTNSTTFTVTGCKCDTSVTITIIARDAEGNRSNPGSALIVTTLSCKTTSYMPDRISEPLQIIPNPATDHITIKGASATADVKIYSATGVLMAQYTNIERPIDISALSGGMYFIKVTENNNMRVFKVCKNR